MQHQHEQPPTKLRVAICGGGVGGLTLAYCLSRHPAANIAVDVYEAAARFTEVGAGIGMWWRTWALMCALGLERDIVALLEAPPRDERVPTLHYRKADQPQGVSFADLTARGGLLTLHRAEFHHLLLARLAACPHVRTHTSKRLRSYSSPSCSASSTQTQTQTQTYAHTQPGPITLTFADGSTAQCDVLVGADGVRSAVRAQLFSASSFADARIPADTAHIPISTAHTPTSATQTPSAHAHTGTDSAYARPHWSGVLAYRALVPAERLRARAPAHRVFGTPTQHLMAYPISHGRYINLAAFTHSGSACGAHSAHEAGDAGDAHDAGDADGPPEQWVADVDPGVVKGLFGGFEAEVGQLLDCLDGVKVSRWAVHVVKPLPTFAAGNVALLGDAAHAMTPFQGAGAGQAIEDAHLLSSLLTHPLTTRATAAHALRVYSDVRRPLAHGVAARSARNGALFAMRGGGDDGDGAGGDGGCGDGAGWGGGSGGEGEGEGGGEGACLEELGRRIQAEFEGTWAGAAEADVRRAVGMLEGALAGP
ncbi:FAD/NAD(P)-binding domain-containing protein [Dentipellis sp. KUC8613]|nr:FAD/NAD(P)-binding domain-containing protein [Dentipellis sp. KUC8613]